MSQKTFSLAAAVVFLIVAIGHLLRVILGATFVIQGFAVPMWASAVAILFLGYLAFQGFRLSGKSRSGP